MTALVQTLLKGLHVGHSALIHLIRLFTQQRLNCVHYRGTSLKSMVFTFSPCYSCHTLHSTSGNWSYNRIAVGPKALSEPVLSSYYPLLSPHLLSHRRKLSLRTSGAVKENSPAGLALC